MKEVCATWGRNLKQRRCAILSYFLIPTRWKPDKWLELQQPFWTMRRHFGHEETKFGKGASPPLGAQASLWISKCKVVGDCSEVTESYLMLNLLRFCFFLLLPSNLNPILKKSHYATDQLCVVTHSEPRPAFPLFSSSFLFFLNIYLFYLKELRER